MTFQTPGSDEVTQVFPEQERRTLEGLYLDQGLAGISARAGSALVIANFLTDQNGILAKVDEHHHFRVLSEIKNASDWRLSQELMAQADVLISGGAYLRSVSHTGSHSQDILHQFEPGGDFEKLGEWRLRAGYKRRSPDLAVVDRSLDFEIPEAVLTSGRRIVVFTTDAVAHSDQAKAKTTPRMVVIGSGDAGVDRNRMIDYLSNEIGYRVIMMATGPSVLELLLEAKRLDLFYVTEAQREIPFDDPSTVRKLLPSGKGVKELKEFSIAHEYLQENVVTEDGTLITQLFLRYDRNSILVDAT